MIAVTTVSFPNHNGKPGSLSGLIFRLENARTPQEFKAALDDMVEAMPPHLDSVKRAVAVWITYVLAPHKGIKLKPRDTENLDEVKNMLTTRIEQWENDILEKGIERGIVKGIEKGIEKGELALFLKMLELKFGTLPTWAQDKIAQASTETIEDWAAKLLKVDRLEDVFK